MTSIKYFLVALAFVRSPREVLGKVMRDAGAKPQ
jgi:hypothetical protein